MLCCGLLFFISMQNAKSMSSFHLRLFTDCVTRPTARLTPLNAALPFLQFFMDVNSLVLKEKHQWPGVCREVAGILQHLFIPPALKYLELERCRLFRLHCDFAHCGQDISQNAFALFFLIAFANILINYSNYVFIILPQWLWLSPFSPCFSYSFIIEF